MTAPDHIDIRLTITEAAATHLALDLLLGTPLEAINQRRLILEYALNALYTALTDAGATLDDHGWHHPGG